MEFSKLLRKIRTHNKDSYRKLGEKTGIIFSYFDKIERGVSPASQKVLEALIKVYPENKEELIDSYCETLLPAFVYDTLTDKLSSTKPIKVYSNKVKVYQTESNTDGILQQVKFEEMDTIMIKIDSKNEFCIDIIGNDIEGFYDKDRLLIEKNEKTLQQLNQKIVVIKNEKELYIKKLVIKDFKVYFESLNNLYVPVEENENIKVIGVVTKLLYRNLDNIKF